MEQRVLPKIVGEIGLDKQSRYLVVAIQNGAFSDAVAGVFVRRTEGIVDHVVSKERNDVLVVKDGIHAKRHSTQGNVTGDGG